ncbi:MULTISPECIES: efflux RND transporter permease subunit [unclassified Arsukibacterium]|uniref:efflux RND transporter permease subunit n=1 Tax=unclassified Arsukibacterium TaxID=2635278 RepID=UPI000C475201|nr:MULTISPECIES: efflux RND transporter permease subunit [unclassified Arsukibacterium]MAA93084.1 acriflavin resistance protein [Rheinheimera sp.]MBM35513.1 acriflavin resistance protein [Rheinheimera sp.]HAW93574.1 AcrB/AcrD/AcrF family protein [Candidatus Azambacteria bacterium]|tara:strand:- start:81437 stop:84586 length:3150 start_codon:yes stop_codon:yes gene_type:complete
MLAAGIRRGTILAVVVLIIAVLGIAAAMRIPVQMIPDLEVRTISVVTGWPGATPQDVEKEILIEQERYLRNLPNLKRMTSLAETGSATIELEFPFGVDINEALIRVSNALSQVNAYPENVDQPRLFSSSFSSNAFMYFRLMPLPGNPLGLDMDMVRDYAEDYVRPRMERVAGVSEIGVSGGAARQVQVLVDPARLAQRGVSMTDVRQAIRNRNTDASAGDIDSGKRRYLLRMVGRFGDLSELEKLIILQRGDSQVLLQDVAKIKLDHFEVRDMSYSDGERTLSLSVRRESGSNVIDIKNAMLPEVERINQDMLAANGLQLKLVSDDVRYVQSSIRNVWTNLGLGALLATLVMYLFLRSPRATLVAVMGVPICTIAAFLGLLLFNRTINVISLAGIAFAIGMTVDNTIVVLESIEQARRSGKKRLDAAISGVQEVWPAVLASTMTTVLVFAPILFVEQEAGQLYSDIAIAIASAIIASMLVAVFVVPAAIARLGFGSGAALTRDDNDNKQPGVLLRTIGTIISSGRSRLLTLVLTLALTVGAGWILLPPAEYLPEGEEPKAFSQMIAPPGYNLSEMSLIAEEIREILNDAVNADPQLFVRGEESIPSLQYYSLSVSVGRIWVLSEPSRDEDIEAMMNGLTTLFRQYPGMRAFSARGSIISSNDGGTRAVALDIFGPDLANLYRTAEAAYLAAGQIFDNPQLNSDPSSLSLDQPLIQIRPRWNRLAELGFDASDFGFAVAALSDGAFVDEFFMLDDKVDIFLFSGAGTNQTLQQLAQAPVLTPQGAVLPLNALADLVEVADSASLRRVDGRRTVTLYIIPPREVALETAVARVQDELVPQLQRAGDIASGVNLSISGAADQLDATKAALGGNFAIALLLIYLLLVAIFTHWGYPLFILATVPLGLAGGLVGLALINGLGDLLNLLGLPGISQPFDMITMLGFLILLGTVVNNPILIVDQSRKNLQQQGCDVIEAVTAAVATRLRPILMSTTTTIFGLAPLVFIPGAGTELYRGVGIIVLTGLLCSTIIALTFLPALLVTVMQWQQRRVGRN